MGSAEGLRHSFDEAHHSWNLFSSSEHVQPLPSSKPSWEQLSSPIAALLLSIAQSHPSLESIVLYEIDGLPTSILVRDTGDTLSKISLIDSTFIRSQNRLFRLNSAGTFIPQTSLDLGNLQRLVTHGSSFDDFEEDMTCMTAENLIGPSILHFSQLKFLSVKLGSKQEAIILGQILTSDAPLLNDLRIAVYHIFDGALIALMSCPDMITTYS